MACIISSLLGAIVGVIIGFIIKKKTKKCYICGSSGTITEYELTDKYLDVKKRTRIDHTLR